jgi:hypothetical protein
VRLATLLEVDINNSFAQIIATVYDELGRIVSQLRLATALKLNLPPKADTERARVSIEIKGESRDRPDASTLKNISDVGRSSTLHAMGMGTAGGLAGGLIGGLLGTLVGGPAGTVGGAVVGAKIAAALGGIFGTIFGVKRGFHDLSERDINWLKQNLKTEAQRQLNTAQRTLTHQLTVLIADERNEIHQKLLRDIQSDKQACLDAVKALRESRQKSGTEAAKLVLPLTNDIKMLDRLEASVRGAAAAEPLSQTA